MKNSTQKMKVMMAGGAVASAAAAANGAIVYHDPVDVTITGRTEQRAYLDLNGGTISSTEVSGVSDLVFIVGASGTSKPYTYLDQVAGSSSALVTAMGSPPDFAAALPSDTTVSAATLAHGKFMDTFISFTPTGLSYFGFSFQEGGNTVYGWLRAEYSVNLGTEGPEDDFNTITVYDWAYETSGAPIVTGSTVPEPSSAAMMAVLAGSAALYRRRARKEVAA